MNGEPGTANGEQRTGRRTRRTHFSDAVFRYGFNRFFSRCVIDEAFLAFVPNLRGHYSCLCVCKSILIVSRKPGFPPPTAVKLTPQFCCFHRERQVAVFLKTHLCS